MTAQPDHLVRFGEQLKIWRFDAQRFVREALKVEYVATWQKEALDAVSTGDRISIRSGHGVGKSTFVAWVTLWFLLTRFPAKMPITANRADQLRDVVWSEIRLWYRQLDPALQVLLEITADRVHWRAAPEECFAVARTARKENPEAFQGFHAKHLAFIGDESSGIDDVVFEVGQGAMSTPGAKTVLTGNPTRTSGYFYNTHHKSRGRWWTRRVSCLEVIEEQKSWPPQHRFANPDYPEEVADEYGLESNVYRYRVLGEFALEEDDVVIPLPLIEGAVGRDVGPSGKRIWGVDVARFGDDRSALAKRRGNHLEEPVKSWRHRDLMQTSGLILNEWEAAGLRKPERILVDSIGMGAGVLDRLKEAGLPVYGVNVGESSSADDKFVRLRDELWWRAREWFDKKDCRIPDDDGLMGELSAVKYDFTSAGKIHIESKDEMKKRGLKSPDLADAFCLTFGAFWGSRAYRKRLQYPQFKFRPFV
jgi:hypothetical protein